MTNIADIATLLASSAQDSATVAGTAFGAMATQRKLRIAYVSDENIVSLRLIEPVSITKTTTGRILLHGKCLGKGAYRNFALDGVLRVEAVKV